MRRNGLVIDVQALHSRSIAVAKYLKVMSEDENSSKNFSLLKHSMSDWLAPTTVIREYYGDEIAIYFEWMNSFLVSIRTPALLGLSCRILNSVFYEDVSESPLNALFSIFMAFWGALFSINWKRKQRSLRILWDNLYYSERQFE